MSVSGQPKNFRGGISAPKSVLLLTAFFILGISAVLRANFNYIDDMARVAEGYIGWGNFSRFTSNGLTALLHLDGYITDISPLTQCIAAFILSVSGVILLYVVYVKKIIFRLGTDRPDPHGPESLFSGVLLL